MVSHSTKWVEAYPVPDHKTTTVTKYVADFVARFGITKELLHDLGADLTAECFQVYLNFFGIKQLKCSVGHPQTNTHCERVHSTMKQMMHAYDACFRNTNGSRVG